MLKLTLLWTACLFLAPILLLQGIWTRKRALKLPEAAGSRSGGDAGPLMLVLGDSVVAGVGVATTSEALPAQLAAALTRKTGTAYRWRALGSNGHRLQDVLLTLQQIQFLEEKPDLIVINVGVNDVSKLTSLTRWQLQLTTLVSEVKQKFSAPLILLGLPPMHVFPLLPQPLRFALGVRAKMLDHSLQKIAGLLPGVFFVSTELPMQAEFMAVDGYHPSAAGVARWCDGLSDEIQRQQGVS
jgi:lysophospholipase L1-like esterase